MSTSLFELVADYRAAADRLSDLDLPPDVVADTLESMTGDIEVKSTNVAYVALNFESAAAAIKEHAAKQMQRARALESRAESLRHYIARSMDAAGLLTIEGPGITISFRKSSAVIINEPGLLPAKFMRQAEPPPPAPDKKAIGDAIKAGEEVPGAHVESRRSLQIK